MRITIGGKITIYPGGVSTPTASLEILKIISPTVAASTAALTLSPPLLLASFTLNKLLIIPLYLSALFSPMMIPMEIKQITTMAEVDKKQMRYAHFCYCFLRLLLRFMLLRILFGDLRDYHYPVRRLLRTMFLMPVG